ncbi:MAG: transcriptional regulator PpsR [Rhizobiales bacterium]|nr:transcriptional regulator PpsR [Hyphomicrobiales bacterium]
MRQFRSIKESLGCIDAEAAARLITAAADVALVLDRNGVILDLAFDNRELDLEGAEGWLGKAWIDTVTIESRPKVQELLDAAGAHDEPTWREINHLLGATDQVPILYAAAQAGGDGQLVVVGRDLGAVALLQQRLVEAQQTMERDYSKLRHAETRYRLLFKTSSDAVMIVDLTERKIQEINPAGARLMAEGAERMTGRAFAACFDERDHGAITAMFAAVQATGSSDDIQVHLAGQKTTATLSASLFRQHQTALLLVRLVPSSKQRAAAALPLAKQKLLNLVESAPDGLLVTDTQGRITASNGAFLDLVELVSEDQARGQSLDRWLGRPGVDLRVITSNLKDHGSVRLFATTLRGEYGSTAEVEVSAVALVNGEKNGFGFAIRHVGQRLSATPAKGPRGLPRSVEQMTELVGRVPLKELVRDATDVIEKLCIEAALELTGDNRASAAEMLGLSRQSLYVKLRRYGMGDMVPDNGGN